MIIISIFALADLHLSFSADKPMDIFKGWDNYVPRIKSNWEKTVTNNDTVIIPGDISWALKLENTKEDLAFIDALPGKKIILKGNHDLWWTTLTKMNKYLTENNFNTITFIHNNCVQVGDYAVCGSRGWFFDDNQASKKVILREAMRLDTSIKAAKATGKQPLVFLHYPVCFNNDCCKEILDVLIKNEITEVWHGHIHGSGKQYTSANYNGITFKLISADCVDFWPQLIK